MKTEIMNIWPGGDAPGASDSRVSPQIVDLAKEYEPFDRAASGVRCPEIAFWYPDESNGVTLLVAPGGGFERIMIDREGGALAMFFTAMGYTLAVMTYRFPQDGHQEGADAPLADAQRAVRVLRHRAARGLNGNHIVMMGFSAGGHIAASVGTRFSDKVYPIQDIADSLSARPDALILLYPVISMREGLAHKESRLRLLGEHPTQQQIDASSLETRVTEQTPPTLLIHAVDDESVSVNNSMVMFSALREHRVPRNCISTRKAGTASASAMWPISLWPVGQCWSTNGCAHESGDRENLSPRLPPRLILGCRDIRHLTPGIINGI